MNPVESSMAFCSKHRTGTQSNDEVGPYQVPWPISARKTNPGGHLSLQC